MGEARPGPLILVVDDDPTVRTLLETSLKRNGFEVESAGDGRQALELITEHEFEAVISDIEMPEMTGIELMSEVRNINLDLPVVLLTGNADVNTAIKAVEYGALRYLTKPVRLGSVTETVRHAVMVHRLARVKRQILEASGHSATVPADLAGLVTSFDRSLENLWMAFQPIVNFRERRVHAYEALVRSDEPSLPTPNMILDAAEQLDRTNELGRAIRAAAAKAFETLGGSELIFVNLLPRDLLDDELYEEDAPLSRHAGRVVLEITERASLHRIDGLARRVDALRDLGFRLAVDDLGAGHSGLACFVQLNPEVAKIDMSLVRDIDADPTKQALVRSMADVCGDMGIDTVAEGAETEGEIRTLAEIGVPLIQGFGIAKPGRPYPSVPPEVFEIG